ncbi:MAG TPA: hypothetical protein PKV51_05275 [Bacillota bacterium]|nr:hypothetical protein [Bacillota bacterium]HPP85294.1 hypothetical protein [Bacillota bacterium]
MPVDLLDKPLLKGLLEGNIPFYELMNSYGIKVIIANLCTKIYGFTYVSNHNNIYIILNGNISYETQCKVLIHELKHIINDIPKQSYYIGLDMQYEYIEKEADMLTEKIIKKI